MKAVFRKQGKSLVPVDEEGMSMLARIKDGRQVIVDVRQPRNPAHHRLLFAMIRFMQEHTDAFAGKDTEIVLTAIKLGTGLVRTFVDQATGNTVLVPLSISFESMDQSRFAEFFDAACKTIADRWLPGNTPEEIRQELLAMIEPERSVA